VSLPGVLGALAALLLSSPAPAVITGGQCVQARGGNSCTANDVTFILVGLGVQDDGCVNSSDTLTIKMGGQLQNTSAGTRYDIGMYIYDFLGTEPGSNPPSSRGYAYNGSSCARETLKPGGTTLDTRCTFDSPAGSLNLLGGNGPFYSEEGDTCADLLKVQTSTTCDSNADGKWDDSFMIFTDPITIKCADGTNGAVDGFADIPTCATWGQNVSEVGGATCDGESEVLPGTPAKCNCQNINSTVPIPSLSLSCSCSPSTVRSGGFTNGHSTACTVTFTNATSCTPNAGTAERFRCGAASFLQFDTVASSTPNGSYFFGSTAGNGATETTGGTVHQPSTGTIRWTPRDTLATGGGTTLGVVGQSQTGTMSFQYFVDPAVPSGTTINFTTTGYWANCNTQDGAGAWSCSPARVAQSALTANCSVTTSNQATWARVASFAASAEDGAVVVEWETAGEVGSRSFTVERKNAETGEFEAVAGVPAVGQLPGGRYRVVDPGASPGGRYTYRVVESDAQGGSEVSGPYAVRVRRVEVERREEQELAAVPKPVSTRVAAAAAPRGAPGGRTASAAAASTPAKPASRALVTVEGSGIVRVATSDVAAALGLNATQAAAQVRSGRLRLSHGSTTVAWQPTASGDGMLFFAPGIESPYTDVDAYWLETATGLTMSAVPASASSGTPADSFADTLHLEVDAIPGIAAPLPVEDFWVWKSFFPGYAPAERATMTVLVPAPAAAPATLAVNVYGFAAQQRAELRWNGTGVGEIAWQGDGAATVAVSLPAGLLIDGANQIEVVALEAAQGFWLDSFDLTYAHRYRASGNRLALSAAAGEPIAIGGFSSSNVVVYDLAQPLAPRPLAGLAPQLLADGTWGVSFAAPTAGPYLAVTGNAVGSTSVRASAPAELRAPGSGAEYLVIAPREWRGEAQRLADLRAAQGLSTLVVDLGDVMDVFAEGVYDPTAIRRFLAHAVASWPTRPRYVALAGKGTYDYRDLMGLHSNLMPTLLATTPEGLAPADGGFADFGGSGVPAVAIGRIPALTAGELGAYVDKLQAYESAPVGAWSRSALLVADNPDSGGDFAATSDGLAPGLAGMTLSRIYLPAGASGAQLQASRDQLQAALRSGQSLVSYVGHGGLDRLATEGLLLTGDVAQLGNGSRLPVVTALTCLIAEFAYPSITSLGEELVLEGGGGAAAVFGPTWLSHNGQAGELGRYLTPELAAPTGGRLGDRVLRALAAYAGAGGDPTTLQTYTLLGDPAINLRR
jgi:hypothetical protein